MWLDGTGGKDSTFLKADAAAAVTPAQRWMDPVKFGPAASSHPLLQLPTLLYCLLGASHQCNMGPDNLWPAVQTTTCSKLATHYCHVLPCCRWWRCCRRRIRSSWSSWRRGPRPRPSATSSAPTESRRPLWKMGERLQPMRNSVFIWLRAGFRFPRDYRRRQTGVVLRSAVPFHLFY